MAAVPLLRLELPLDVVQLLLLPAWDLDLRCPHQEGDLGYVENEVTWGLQTQPTAAQCSLVSKLGEIRREALQLFQSLMGNNKSLFQEKTKEQQIKEGYA